MSGSACSSINGVPQGCTFPPPRGCTARLSSGRERNVRRLHLALNPIPSWSGLPVALSGKGNSVRWHLSNSGMRILTLMVSHGRCVAAIWFTSEVGVCPREDNWPSASLRVRT